MIGGPAMDTDSRLQRIEQDLAELKGGQADLKATLAQALHLLARIGGRLDEQRATIDALIPTRIAAVPPAAG